jgi:hypothetical protein
MVTMSDQPGRYFAVFILSPALLLAGVHLRQSGKLREPIGTTMMAFGFLFLIYETYWISCSPPRICVFPNDEV